MCVYTKIALTCTGSQNPGSPQKMTLSLCMSGQPLGGTIGQLIV